MLRLSDIADCFEGVIPSVIATSDEAGEPNVSYLSHVIRIDDDHVGLSNQFFGKTNRNLLANPQAAILLVDPRTGAQFRLKTVFRRSVAEGALFDRVAAQLAATSAQVGMAGVMRLKAVDVFEVLSLTPVSIDAQAEPARDAAPLTALAALSAAIADAGETATIVDALLDAARSATGSPAAILYMRDGGREALTAIGSRGYGRSGIGAEIPFGDGPAGLAAAEGRVVKISDLSRVSRLAAAVQATAAGEEERTRVIARPGLPGAQSQIAVPLTVRESVEGVLLCESRERLAFGQAEEATLSILARQAAAMLALEERLAQEGAGGAAQPAEARARDRLIEVRSHGYDGSVFVDGHYVIKGVGGRLLAWLVAEHEQGGRTAFTNRELRLAPALRLPDFKDNLETRLLLLRRRLDEKEAAIRIVRTGRGTFRIDVAGQVRLQNES